MTRFLVLLFALSSLFFSDARSQHAEDGILTLEEVLASSATHYPMILKSLADRRAAAGDALAAQGEFDLVFSADGFSRVSGFWDGSIINGEVRRNLRPFGASVYGGYKISDGSFPIYEDINFTNTLGEAKLGIIFSLLRDRKIDQRRFGVGAAELDLEKADLDVLLTQIGVQHQAQIAYWRWVAAGRALEIYEQLLTIAKERQQGLEEEVRQGARAAIFLTENQQNITRREILTAQARRDFDMAANALSMFYRDDQGQRALARRPQLPEQAGPEAVVASLEIDEGAQETAFLRRPELQILSVQFEQARQELALNENDLKPRLDLRYEVSRDFGEVAEGGISRDSTDNIVGLRFSVPFERRKARGGVAKARARIDALRQQRRQTEDQIAVEVRRILLSLDAGRVLTSLAAREVSQANIMQQAERSRFASGASDFFLVNVREETAANARIRYISAALEARVAKANYDAATANLRRLGLEDAS
ncbi:MAG: TolC family protein [Pseudomonadota bacterium]